MIERTSETIVAVSSAAGASATGIVRLDGPRAIELAATFLRLSDPSAHLPVRGTPAGDAQAGARRIEGVPGFTRFSAEIVLDEGVQSPAAIYLFRSPRSYTRNDLVEIHAPGSPALLRWIVDEAVRRGARRAAPGEFTARAFLNGAMSLAEAEAVAEVIRAGTDRELAVARYARSGRLSREVKRVADEVADLAALVEAQIDFAEEPIEFIPSEELRRRVDALDEALAALARPVAFGERDLESPRVLLAGRPNAGKSTLFNALLGKDRAITSSIAGTTRDVLAATIRLGTIEAVLMDAAGIDVDDAEWSAATREAVRREAARADLIVLVVDASRFRLDELTLDRDRGLATDVGAICAAHESVSAVLSSRPAILVLTKCDLISAHELHALQVEGSRLGFESVAAVCAPQGRGLATLRELLAARLAELRGTAGGAATVLNARQAESVSAARAALARAAELLRGSPSVSEQSELLAFELREALDALGEIIGAVTTDDLLGRVFAGFCIGK